MNPNTRSKLVLLAALGLVLLSAPEGWAQETKIDTGDRAWLLVSSALVMAMALPGLTFFYGVLSGTRATALRAGANQDSA